MGSYDALLKPLTIKHVTFRNRIMGSSHAPAYGKDGKPQERYQLYHEEKAKGGIGLAMFGGSSSVSINSPAALWNQISVGDDSVIPYFKQFSARIHRHGAKLMCQLTHMGRRARWDSENWLPTISPSPLREPAHRSFPKEMEDFDIERVQDDFAQAARRCREGDLDGCEFVFTGHINDQFLCPATNQRTDQYGGSLENRMRFPLEMLAKARAQVGDDFLLGIRITGDDLLEGGNSMQECLEILKRFGSSGHLDFLNVVGGNVFTHATLAVNVPNMAFPPAQFLYLASAARQMTGMPVFYANNVKDLATASRAVEEGHCDMLGMTRGHIADPYIVSKLMRGPARRYPPMRRRQLLPRPGLAGRRCALHPERRHGARGHHAASRHAARRDRSARSWWPAPGPPGWRRPGSPPSAAIRSCCSRRRPRPAARSASPPRPAGARPSPAFRAGSTAR